MITRSMAPLLSLVALYWCMDLRPHPLSTTVEFIDEEEEDLNLTRMINSPPTGKPFATDADLEKGETDPVFRKFNALRAQGLQEWIDFLTTNHLAGFEKADVVESVCGDIKVHEEKQMCRKRGRRIGETMLKHFTSINSGLARSSQKTSRKRYVMRIVLRQGKMLGWNWGKGRRPFRLRSEKPKHAFVLARLMGILRQGKMHYNHSISVLIQNDDQCEGAKQQYPITWFATGSSCPHVVPLSGNYLQQMQGFTPEEPMREYKNLTNKVFMRASGYNEHRWDTFLLSGSDLLPWLDSKQVAANNLGRSMEKGCENHVSTLKAINPPIFEGTGFPNHNQCQRNQHSVHGSKVSYDHVISHKYMLLVDGIVACYRLGPQLQAPGVLMLVQQSHTNMSYSPDLIPYVHYLPIDEDRKNLPTSLNSTYHWAEKYAETTESIAKESTRWGRLHADDKAHNRDWELYVAFLAHMSSPETDEGRDAARDIEAAPPSCPTSSDYRSFFRVNPFDKHVPDYAKARIVRMACSDE